MLKFKIPEWEKAYIYIGIAAAVLVLLFTWGQLSFFTWGQLQETPKVGNPADIDKSIRIKRPSSSQGFESLPSDKKPGFFRSVRTAFQKYEQRRYVEKLKKLGEKSDSDEDKVQVNLFLAEYYANELKDEAEAQRYYEEAVRISGNKIPGYPQIIINNENLSDEERLTIFSSRSLLEIGRLQKQMGRPEIAKKALRRMVRDYGKTNGNYRRAPEIRRDTHAALEELAAMRAQRSEPFPPYKLDGDDPLKDLQRIVKLMITAMVRNKPKDILPLISPAGIESGLAPGIKQRTGVLQEEHYSKEAVEYELEQKEGPHYVQLFEWLKKNRIRPGDIKYWITMDGPSLFLVQIVYIDHNRTQQLYFRIIKNKWYLVYVSLD